MPWLDFEKSNRGRKLATVSLGFTADDGFLGGLSIDGFSVWKPRDGETEPSVTFPSRPWVDGNGKTHYHWILTGHEDENGKAVWVLRQRIIASYLKWAEVGGRIFL